MAPPTRAVTAPIADALPIGTVVVAADSTGTVVVGPPRPPSADSMPAPVPVVVLDSAPERLSVYRAAAGLRRADELSPGERMVHGLTVAALLDSAGLALPDTSTFRTHDYRRHFTPEYVSQPTIGYAQDNFGRGVFGGTSIVLSDLLGNERLAISGAVNGRISEAQLFAAYANYSHRLQYVTGLSQAPYFWLGGGNYAQLPDGTISSQQELFRYIVREGFFTALFPRDRFRRYEFGARLTNLQKDTLLVNELYDAAGRLLEYDYHTQSGGMSNMVSPYVAYVSDNTLFGYTTPILGHRYRLQLSPTVGNWQWMEYLVDYRRYDPILFNVLTIATRVQGVAKVGRNENEFLEALRPEFIRGYDRQLYYRQNCIGQAESQCVGYDELIGSRVVFANAEARFPLLRRVDLGFLPVSLPPIDGHLFYDAGVAWRGGQRVVLSRRQQDDPNERSILTSWGAGMRVNLFGFAILRLDYAIPLDHPDHHGYWTWMLGGYGF